MDFGGFLCSFYVIGQDYENINTEVQKNAFTVFNGDWIIRLAFVLFCVLKVSTIYDVTFKSTAEQYFSCLNL